MEAAYGISQSGLFASNIRQNVIANNLSNLTTTGFKSKMAEAATVWSQGTKVEAVRPNFELGAPVESFQDTDLYLAGDGFFKVELDGVVGYTRDGSFHIDSEGDLVTAGGYKLDPNITIPNDSVGLEITSDGQVFSVDGAGNGRKIGEITVARFINPAGLVTIGDNLYVEGIDSGTPTEGTPGEDEFPTVRQGFLEESNVDPVEEMASLLKNNRTYQLNLRVLQTTDAIVGNAIDLFS